MKVAEEECRDAPHRLAYLLAVNALGLYAMLMYGITYYAVTTSASRMAGAFGQSASSIFAVITASLLITAAIAPRFGQLTDRVGAANVLLAGAALRSVLLAAMAVAPEPATFALALLSVQILGQATEYDATFAAAVDLAGVKARSGMSQITLWGGLASTAFWPLTAFMLDRMDWRALFLLYAAVLMLVCVPIAALVRWISTHRRRSRATTALVTGPVNGAAGEVSRPTVPPPFWLVSAAFALGGITYNLPSLMLPILEGLGLGGASVMIGMIFGPAQTAGRFVDMVVGDRVRAITVAVTSAAMVAISLSLLLAGGVWGGLAFAVLFGAGAGVGYVVRGSVVLSFYGPAEYATWLERLGRVRLIVTALSPLGLVLVLERCGAAAVVSVCGVAALLSLACFLCLAMRVWDRIPRSSAAVG